MQAFIKKELRNPFMQLELLTAYTLTMNQQLHASIVVFNREWLEGGTCSSVWSCGAGTFIMLNVIYLFFVYINHADW